MWPEPEPASLDQPAAAAGSPARRKRRLRGVVEEEPLDGAADYDLPPAVLPPPAPEPPGSADRQER
jgi:hypothetical protein